MNRVLILVNAVLTLPFGIVALWAPTPVFAQFGVQLDAGGALIARGYGATLVAYGIALALLRDETEPRVLRALLLSMVAFNVIEAVIQGMAGMNGVASSAVYGNVVVHAIVAALCLRALSK